ncbi:MAG: alpha/beta fold hydrolase [Verrucomicrobia bacterium]|jgi:pimeloyl-ACP methyl ester carboxylesterase|nr:alpha/beta fold hydrolase [Verrucomicrobiota bacterium]
MPKPTPDRVFLFKESIMNAAAYDRLLWKSGKKPPDHPETRLISTQNAELRVRDTGGAGAVVAFFCDPPVTVEAYDALLEQFRKHYRVLVIELPGFGFSRPRGGSGYEFGRSVEAMEEVLQDVDTDGMILCGPCICGFVATELANRQHLPVKGLVLMQTPDMAGMLEWRKRMDPKGLLRTPFVGQSLVRATANRLSRFWLKYATARSFDPTDLVHTTVGAQKKGAAFPLATMLQRWRKGPVDGALDLPTLAIWGLQDRSHRNTGPECTLKHAPEAQIVSFQQCGHFTELEQPEAFSEVARPFISECLG